MWFYNTSKFIQNYVIDLKTNEFKLFKIINNDEINFYNLQNTIIEFLRVNNNKDKINEFFINLILNGFNYNELIITTVIKSFNLLENNENSKSLVKLSDKDEDKGSIKDQILKLINKNLDNNNDINFVNGLKDHWLKFQNSCEDLRKQCQDPISLMINDNDEEFIIIIKNYEYSIIKNVSIHEIINYNNEIKITNEIFDEISYLNKYSNKQINEINSLNLLIKLIKNFKKIFSNNEIFKIENLINENLYDLNNIEISNNLMNLLYDEIISGKLNNLITEQLINELNNIPDIMNTIDNLISISYNKDEFFFNNLEFEKNFGNLSNSILLILVKNEILIEFNIIIGLILIIITVDRNELMNKLFLKLINKVKYYNLNLKLFEIGFKDSSNNGLLIIEKDNCFNIENCLFNKIIKLILFKDNKLGIKINQKNINDLVYYLIEFSTNEFFIISILSNLISINQESLIIDKKFNSIINPNDADENIDKDTRSIFQLINGIILMKLDKVEESFKVFVDNSHNIIEFFKDEYENNGGRKDTNTIIKRNKLLISLIPINSIINKFNDVNLIEYYMNLSLIFEKLNFNLVSLKFQIESMKIFNQFKQGLIKINSIEANEIDKIEINQQVNCFKLSIKVDNFELSYNTILNINNKSNEDIQFNYSKI
ncbi:unnamed protein product [[Candida] boidinii]|nr:unnamed protein product [[Candida] boidinii]